MLFWIRWSQGWNQPDILQEPTFRIQDLRIPKALLTTCSHASLERAHESKTTHMSLGSVPDFVLFDLGMVIYQASLACLFLSPLDLFVRTPPWFWGAEMVAWEDL